MQESPISASRFRDNPRAEQRDSRPPERDPYSPSLCVNSSFAVADLKVEIGATRVEGYDSMPPCYLEVLGDAEVLLAGHGYRMSVRSEAE